MTTIFAQRTRVICIPILHLICTPLSLLTALVLQRAGAPRRSNITGHGQPTQCCWVCQRGCSQLSFFVGRRYWYVCWFHMHFLMRINPNNNNNWDPWPPQRIRCKLFKWGGSPVDFFIWWFTRDLISVPAPLNAYTALQLCSDYGLLLLLWRRPRPLATSGICF